MTTHRYAVFQKIVLNLASATRRFTHSLLLVTVAGFVLMSAAPAAAQCSDPSCLSGDGVGPEVGISPDGGSYEINVNTTQSVPVKILFSDADGLRPETVQIQLWTGGVATAVTGYTWHASDIGSFGSASKTLELKDGDYTLTARIQDAAGSVGSNQATFRVVVRNPNVAPVVSMAPHHEGHRLTSLGAATLTYAMPSYTSMDADRAVGLYYSSQHANPTGFVQLDVDTGTAAEGSVAAAVTLQIHERDASKPDGIGGAITSEDAWAKDPSGKQRVGAQWSMRDKPTGAYRYWAVVRSYRQDKTLIGTTRVEFRVLVINHVHSRYGSGWSLAGVQRIYPTGDGKVDGLVLDEGNGVVRFFEKVSCAVNPCTYRSPEGDFSTMTYTVWSDLWGQYTRTYPDGTQIAFAGRTAGSMTQIVDRFGNVTSYEWRNTWETENQMAVISRIADPAGKVTAFEYHSGIYLKQITDPAGRTASFSFVNGDLSQITGPTNLAVTYDATHRPVSYTDSAGTWGIAYDAHGTVRELITPAVAADGQNVSLTTTYRSLHFMTVLGSWATHISCCWADPVPAAAVMTSVADPLGHKTETAIDRYGNTTKIVDPLGRSRTYVYNKHGLPQSISNGVQTVEFSWNAYGRLLAQTVNGTVAYSASYAGNQLEYEVSGGVERWYTYGSRGQLLTMWTGKVDDAAGKKTTYEYDPAYRLIAMNGPSGERTEWSYVNTWANVSEIRHVRADGVRTTQSFTYDGAGRSRTATDARGQTFTFTYDPLNRTEQAADALGRTVKFGYTGPFLTRVTDQAGKVYGYTYNALGWLESETFPEDTTSRTYRYNKDGQMISSTDRRGRTVKSSYDFAHRTLSRASSGVTLNASDVVNTTYQYPDAHTIIASNKETTETTHLDPVTGGLALLKGTIGGPSSSRYYEIATAYDHDMAPVGIDIRQYQDATMLRVESIRYAFNPRPADTSLAQTLAITDVSGRTTTLGYDVSGRHVRTAFPNGVTQYNSYRQDGTLQQRGFSSNTLHRELGASYNQDDLGAMTARTSVAGDFRRTYEYDADGQLLDYRQEKLSTVWGCDPSQTTCDTYWEARGGESYTYDAVGNRTDRNATRVANSNRYQTFDGFTLEYDTEGNLTRKLKAGFDQRLTWNDLGQLSSVTTNGVTVTYGYSPGGKRIRRTEGSRIRYSVYHQNDLLFELDGSGNSLNAYTHMPGTDRPLSVKQGGNSSSVYYYTMEAPGHVDTLLNTSGGIAAKYSYAPFGRIESASETVSQSLKFMGRELDESTGLYFVRARWYDPSLARFVSSDPIGLQGGVNTYAYVGNDPMNKRDPSGLQSTKEPTLEPLVICTRLFSWGWDWCGANDLIFAFWARQRESEDNLIVHGYGGVVKPDPVSMGRTPSLPPPPAPQEYPSVRAYPDHERMTDYAIRAQQCADARRWALAWTFLHTVGRVGAGLHEGRSGVGADGGPSLTATKHFDRNWGTSLGTNYAEEARDMAATACFGVIPGAYRGR